MDQRLERLKEALRAEKCPPHVLERVHEQIAREGGSGWAVSKTLVPALGLVLLVTLSVAWWMSDLNRVEKPGASAQLDASDLPRARVVEEAHLSLACIGCALIEAGNRTETLLRNELTPRLIEGLEKAGQAIKH